PFPSRGDYPSHVLARRLAPVPHVERMHAVIGVAVAVHVNVGGGARELGLEVALEFGGLGGFAEAAMEELDVTRMMFGMELVAQRMADDHGAALAYQRLAAEHVEQIAEARALHQHGVHHRVDVVRTDV